MREAPRAEARSQMLKGHSAAPKLAPAEFPAGALNWRTMAAEGIAGANPTRQDALRTLSSAPLPADRGMAHPARLKRRGG
jgi:hypothetical protein